LEPSLLRTYPIYAIELVGIITHGTRSDFFFKKNQINIMEAWDDEGKLIIHSSHWKKRLVLQQLKNTKFAYYMMLNLL
jgi:hypothetical protein